MQSIVQRSRRLPHSLIRTVSTLSAARGRNAPIDVHPEVEDALATGKPIVAMETALVTNGMPYPTNLTIATELEDIVRSSGVVPATIGFIGGRIKIGLQKHELERLAEGKGSPTKISRRDIAPAIALNKDGGTTICATMIFAALAGIKVFATGGLGGVHRGGENSLDISADLQELARCPVGVVSSGAKSILDIGRTLEYLETLGVPVMAYGESREFPAFFTRRSGFEVPWNVTDPKTAAEILHTQWQLGMENGALIAVPIPEEYEADGDTIQKCIDQAVAESEANGISKRGKEATPWLLDRVLQLSEGASLRANLGLIRNTTIVGSQIAIQYQKLVNECEPIRRTYTLAPRDHHSLPKKNVPVTEPTLSLAEILVVGSAAIDITAQTVENTDPALVLHSTAPGAVTTSLGGVARNIAEASHRVVTRIQDSPSSVLLVAPVGGDAFGRLFIDETTKLGMRTDGLVINDTQRTAVCNMVLGSDGTLIGGVADMGITEAFKPTMIIPQIQKHDPYIVALDGNLTPNTLDAVVSHCQSNAIKREHEPTSLIKSTSILRAVAASLKKTPYHPIDFFTPNLLELAHIYNTSKFDPFDIMSHPIWWETIDNFALGSAFRMDLEQLARKTVQETDSSKGTLAFIVDQGIAQMAVNLLPFFRHIVIKCGILGVLVVMHIPGHIVENSPWKTEGTNIQKRRIIARGKHQEIVVLQHFAALPVQTVINVTGAGDSFVGALLAYLGKDHSAFESPDTLQDAIFVAQKAASLSLQSHSAVSPVLSEDIP